MKTERDFLDKLIKRKTEKQMKIIGYTTIRAPKGVVETLEKSGINTKETTESFLWELLKKTNPEIYKEIEAKWREFIKADSWEQREMLKEVSKGQKGIIKNE